MTVLHKRINDAKKAKVRTNAEFVDHGDTFVRQYDPASDDYSQDYDVFQDSMKVHYELIRLMTE